MKQMEQRKRLTVTHHIILGLLLGLLVMPPRPVQAQWTVYDPAQFTLQLEKKIEEAARWLETVDKYRRDIEQYVRMYEKAVEQLTTLRGMLNVVDEQLAKQKNLIFFVNDVGRIIRGSFTLYRELENMVLLRIRALKNIDDRLRNGILDLDQDKRDFETYLRYTIGRSARDTLSQRVRLAQRDTQLAFWMDEKQKLETQIATYNRLYKDAKAQYEDEMRKPPDQQNNIQHLAESIAHYETLIAELTRQHAELTEKINERVAQYGVRIQDMENFARQVVSTNEAWRSLMVTRDNLTATLDDLVAGR